MLVTRYYVYTIGNVIDLTIYKCYVMYSLYSGLMYFSTVHTANTINSICLI